MSKKEFWICGKHSVYSALLSKKRRVFKVISSIENNFLKKNKIKYQIKNQSFFNNIFGKSIAHQGIAALVGRENYLLLKDCLNDNSINNVVIIDGISDTRNIGSILRNACLFGIDLIIAKDREFPEDSFFMHKASSGAIEFINICKVSNLSNAIKILKENNFWISSFDIKSKFSLDKHQWDKKNAIIFGSENEGIKKNLLNKSDYILKINTKKTFIDSLNVSNLSAIVFCDLFTKKLK